MRGALTKILLVSMMLVALAYEAGAQRYDRGYDFSKSGVFVKKGTWWPAALQIIPFITTTIMSSS